MNENCKRLADLSEKEALLKIAQTFRGVLFSMGIIEKLEPIKRDDMVPRLQVAKEYGVSTVTLDKWAKYGQIPKPIKKGGRIFYSRKELNEFNEKFKKK